MVRAAEILYQLDERDMLASIYAELGESGTDIAGMAMLGEVASKHGDGRAMLLLGQGAYGRGLPLDYYAYPIVGLPDFRPISPPVDPAVTYRSRAKRAIPIRRSSRLPRYGLHAGNPEAAQDTAEVFKAEYAAPSDDRSGLQHADGHSRSPSC